MNIRYDRENDTLTVNFRHAPITQRQEERPGLILDYDDSGYLVALELLSASRAVEDPDAVDLVVVGEG